MRNTPASPSWQGALSLIGLGLTLFGAAAPARAQPPINPEALFVKTCAGCHENPAARAPDRAALRQISPEAIYAAVTTGAMAPMAKALDDGQKRILAEYIADRKLGVALSGEAKGLASYCGPLAALPQDAAGDYNGWANGADGARFQRDPRLSPAKLGALKLKWAFGLPAARNDQRTQPDVGSSA